MQENDGGNSGDTNSSDKASSAAAAVRFWGVVRAVKPRLVLTKFDGETTAKSHGHLLIVEGTRRTGDAPAGSPHFFTVAVGKAAQEKRGFLPGDLIRGDAHPVPPHLPDTPADLYRALTLRTIARAGEPGAGKPFPLDPPRTDSPLPAPVAETAPRRALRPAHLAPGGPCVFCPYGAVVPVVRLSDPRDYRSGAWSQVPACLGPADCPHFAGV